MNKIPSFTIDHSKLKRGLYVSRQDMTDSGDVITTFDIRTEIPNVSYMAPAAVHTIEHIAATYMRNDEAWKDKIIYFGPMGCLTGFYLIVAGCYSSKDVLPFVQATFKYIAEHDGEVPGTKPEECGNYKLHNRFQAKAIAKNYYAESLNFTKENLIYPE